MADLIIDGTSVISKTGSTVSITNDVAFPAGHILQVKTGTLTSNFNSTTSGVWLDTGLKVAITPSSTSNKVYVQASVINVGNSASGYNVQVSILHYSSSFVASDDNQIFTTSNNRQFNGQGPNPGNDGVARDYCWGVLHSPATESEITYVVAVKGEGSGTSRTIYFNQGHSSVALYTCITAMEVAG
tara:strand:- start:8061 stop:8618 length:558 start_codon:yes stop_codon:yes gene_type:complete